MGNVVQAGNKMNPARQAAIHGGLPVEVPAMTVNRVCGSGAQAIASAAQEIMLGYIDCASRRHGEHGPRAVSDGQRALGLSDGRRARSTTACCATDSTTPSPTSIPAGTRKISSKSCQITREEQDRWAERSQQRFAAAQAAGKFADEIVAGRACERNKPGLFNKDEHNRPDTTFASLAKLRPAFRKDGTITAGNAPGLNSGAAAMMVSSADWAEQERPRADGASCCLRRRRRRAGMFGWSGPRGEAGAGARRMEDW